METSLEKLLGGNQPPMLSYSEMMKTTQENRNEPPAETMPPPLPPPPIQAPAPPPPIQAPAPPPPPQMPMYYYPMAHPSMAHPSMAHPPMPPPPASVCSGLQVPEQLKEILLLFVIVALLSSKPAQERIAQWSFFSENALVTALLTAAVATGGFYLIRRVL